MEAIAIYLMIFPVELNNPLDIAVAETAIKQLATTEEFNFIPLQEYYYCNQTVVEFIQKNNDSWDRVRDYPRLIDGRRFIFDYHYAAGMRMIYMNERNKIQEIKLLNQDRGEQFDPYIEHIEWKRKCWDALEDGISPYGNNECKRKRLQDLKELLGDEMWNKGEMPL